MDAFMCSCGACRGFWKKRYGQHAPLLEKSSLSRAAETAIMLLPVMKKEDHPAVLKLGDRVIVKGQHKGNTHQNVYIYMYLLLIFFVEIEPSYFSNLCFYLYQTNIIIP